MTKEQKARLATALFRLLCYIVAELIIGWKFGWEVGVAAFLFVLASNFGYSED